MSQAEYIIPGGFEEFLGGLVMDDSSSNSDSDVVYDSAEDDSGYVGHPVEQADYRDSNFGTPEEANVLGGVEDTTINDTTDTSTDTNDTSTDTNDTTDTSTDTSITTNDTTDTNTSTDTTNVKEIIIKSDSDSDSELSPMVSDSDSEFNPMVSDSDSDTTNDHIQAATELAAKAALEVAAAVDTIEGGYESDDSLPDYAIFGGALENYLGGISF